jgi:predicted enzyme related to lactoylglutathione lyase
MAEFAPGTPSWVDLAAPDIDAAKAFYRGLFGWEARDAGPAEETGGYGFFVLDGRLACGFGPPGPGEPPSWRTIVSVADADETAVKVERAGGKVLLQPMDVMDEGRIATFADTVGAVFAVWQPGRHRGAEVVNQPGSLCWNELATRDTQKPKDFYGAVFGWKASGGDYTEWRLDGRLVAGMVEMGDRFPPEALPQWVTYFAVEDVDLAARRAEGLGGSVTVPPFDVPEVGRVATLGDPNGALFSVVAPTQPVE